jgi:hypothetical protein
MPPMIIGSQASNSTGLGQTDRELREAYGEEH